MKGKEEDDSLKKLVALTKLMKKEKVKVSLLGPSRSANKWRSAEPKFAPKAEKPEGTVEAGGMNVDPALKEEYENWRRDKEEEAAYHRVQNERKARAAEEARRRRENSKFEEP